MNLSCAKLKTRNTKRVAHIRRKAENLGNVE
jgi:hypothetical protein